MKYDINCLSDIISLMCFWGEKLCQKVFNFPPNIYAILSCNSLKGYNCAEFKANPLKVRRGRTFMQYFYTYMYQHNFYLLLPIFNLDYHLMSSKKHVLAPVGLSQKHSGFKLIEIFIPHLEMCCKTCNKS